MAVTTALQKPRGSEALLEAPHSVGSWRERWPTNWEGSRSNMRSISVRPFDAGGHELRGPCKGYSRMQIQ